MGFCAGDGSGRSGFSRSSLLRRGGDIFQLFQSPAPQEQWFRPLVALKIIVTCTRTLHAFSVVPRGS